MDATDRMNWRAFGRHLKVARIVVGISEQEAACDFGVTIRTYRKYDAGREPRGSQSTSRFARKHGISQDWLLFGEGALIRPHLPKGARGKVAILPALSPRWRRPIPSKEAALLGPRFLPSVVTIVDE
jgi:hypothetical protein